MNQNNISAAELFLRVRELLILPELEPKTRNKMMHDTLILCCHEGVKETKQAFGNLFSQVDYLCKAHGIKVADKIAHPDHAPTQQFAGTALKRRFEI